MLSIDAIIFLIFLIINLVVGILCSRGVTSLEKYAIGERNFSTSSIVATIAASWLSAGFLSYTLAETYRQGLYFILPALGDSLAIIFIGYFFVSRMGEFLGKLSIAEAMGDLFGSKVKAITAIIGIVVSIGTLGAQFKVASKLLELIFGASGFYATILSAGIIILYSAFGGIKAVTFTDIFQLFTFSLVVPVIFFIIFYAIDDYSIALDALSTNTTFNISSVLDLNNPKFYEMIGLAMIFLPFLPNFEPIIFQRIAMASSIKQAAKAFKIAGLICLGIQVTIIFIAILLLSDNPNLNPNELLNYILNHYSSPGVNGFIAIGIMAMLMSTADSLINAMAVIFAHDLCKPLGFKWSQNELNVSKIFSVVSGILGVIFALKFTSILDIIVLVFGLYISVVSLPFILAILGFRSSEKSVLIGMVAGGAAFILCQLKLIEANVMTDPCSLGIITNIVFLFASHYLLRQPGGFVGIKNGHNKADV